MPGLLPWPRRMAHSHHMVFCSPCPTWEYCPQWPHASQAAADTQLHVPDPSRWVPSTAPPSIAPRMRLPLAWPMPPKHSPGTHLRPTEWHFLLLHVSSSRLRVPILPILQRNDSCLLRRRAQAPAVLRWLGARRRQLVCERRNPTPRRPRLATVDSRLPIRGVMRRALPVATAVQPGLANALMAGGIHW